MAQRGVPVAGNVRVAAVVARLHGRWCRGGVAATLAAVVVSHLLFAVVKKNRVRWRNTFILCRIGRFGNFAQLKSPIRNYILPLLAESPAFLIGSQSGK